MRVRPRWALLLLVPLVLGSAGCGRYRHYQRERAREAARKEAPLNYVPGVAPDTGSALAGSDGIDADGAPLRYVDRIQVRGMLARKQYAQLTQLFEDLQAGFEAKPILEAWPMDAAEAFESGEALIDADLDAWVAASPASFAPYLARGVHRVMVGYALRGGYLRSLTPTDALRAMTESYQTALPDLKKAVSLRPNAQEAYRQMARIGGHLGDRALLEKANADASAACPSCFRERTMYMTMQMPRWGGEYGAMASYAGMVASAGPKTRYLAGYVDLDKARALDEAGQHVLALPVIGRACALGDYWEFLHARAKIERARGDASSALADVRRADALRPGYPDILAELADEEADAEQWEAAGTDLFRVLQMNPTNFFVVDNAPYTFEGLIADAEGALKDGNTTVAARESALASHIALDDPRARKLRDDLDRAGGASTDDLRREVERDPGSFEATQKLDHQLDREGHRDQIIPLWDAYLTHHPDDGRAYLERGGAYFNAHHMPEATADANKACSLGDSEGCVRAKQLAHGMTH